MSILCICQTPWSCKPCMIGCIHKARRCVHVSMFGQSVQKGEGNLARLEEVFLMIAHILGIFDFQCLCYLRI